MRPIFTLIFAASLFLNGNVLAQSFELGTGTEWTYCQQKWIPFQHNTTNTLSIVGDTLINGEMAFILDGKCQCGFAEPRYVRKEGEKIYFYRDDAKHLLYDFGLVAGDTLIVNITESVSILVGIDSVGTILLNGVNKKIQYVNQIAAEDNQLWSEWGQFFIEDFGAGGCFFPMYPTCDPGTGPLLTIEIPGLPKAEIDDAECLILSTKELDQMNISVFPIPANEELIIRYTGSSDKMDISIFNVMGTIIESFALSGAEQKVTDVSSWLPGVYILQVRSGNRFATSKILIGVK